jgi:hypothetical protein
MSWKHHDSRCAEKTVQRLEELSVSDAMSDVEAMNIPNQSAHADELKHRASRCAERPVRRL